MVKRVLNGFFAALGMFSALPAPRIVWDDAVTGLLLPMFPAVGAVFGALWYGAARLLAIWGPPAALHAVLLCLLPWALSGFLHLDGYMDVADAVFSRRPREEKLRILKDSHTGAFACIALGVLLLLSCAGAHALVEKGAVPLALLFVPIVSRCVCGALLLRMPLLFETGYAAAYRAKTPPAGFWWLCALGAACLGGALLWGGAAAALPLAVLAAAEGLCALRLKALLGGISGDVSGCILTLGELCAVLCMALL